MNKLIIEPLLSLVKLIGITIEYYNITLLCIFCWYLYDIGVLTYTKLPFLGPEDICIIHIIWLAFSLIYGMVLYSDVKIHEKLDEINDKLKLEEDFDIKDKGEK